MDAILGAPANSSMTLPPTDNQSQVNTPYNFKIAGSPTIDVLKQAYKDSGGNPALVPDDQWNTIQKKYQDAMSGKIPTTDVDRSSAPGIGQSVGEFGAGMVSTLPGVNVDPASNTAKVDLSDFINGATGVSGAFTLNDASKGFHSAINWISGNKQTPAVNKEVDNANDFFNKNIQTQVIEKGANIDPTTGIYTPPLSYNIGKGTGVVEQILPAISGIGQIAGSILEKPWTAAAKSATQVVEDAKAALQKSIDNSVPGNISGNIQDYTNKMNKALQSASDYAKQIPGLQNTIDFGNNAINMAKGVISDAQDNLKTINFLNDNLAPSPAFNKSIVEQQVRIKNAQSLIDQHTPLVADAQSALKQISDMPQINQQSATDYQSYLDKLNAEANTYKAKAWDAEQPNVIAAQKAQKAAIADQKSVIFSNAAKAGAFGALAGAGGAIGGGAAGSAYEILKNLIGH